MNNPYYQDRPSMNESLPQSQRRRHRRQYPVDSADQGAGGYRFGSFRGSDTSGGSGSFRARTHPDGEQQQREYQQQLPQQIRHNDGVANENFASFGPLRANRRQSQQQRLSGTQRASASSRRTSLSSSYASRGIDQTNSHGSSFNRKEMSSQRRGHESYNDIAFSPRRQSRAQNTQSQSRIITTVRQHGTEQNLASNKLQTNKEEEEEEEEEEDEFDTIPLQSNEYLKELNSRSATMQMNNDDSDTNRLNPNNNNDSDNANSFENSTLSQNGGIATKRSNENSEMLLHNRVNLAPSDGRNSSTRGDSRQHRLRSSVASTDTLASDQRGMGRNSSYLIDQLNRNDRRQQRQPSNGIVSSSLNENQLRRNRRSDPKLSSPLFHSQRRQSTGDVGIRANYDIRGPPFRQSYVGISGYDNRIFTNDPQGEELFYKNSPESMLAHDQRPMEKKNGSIEKESGFVGTAAESLNSEISVSLVKRKKKLRLLSVIGICLVAVIVIVVVVVYITTYQSSDQRQPQVPLNDTEIILECEDCISKPVSDIEGRCSSSNLPGSLSACQEACAAAACCYSNFEGEKCYDYSNEATLLACGQYKPHCDVIHRPWPGSSKGLIPNAPISLFEGRDWDEICRSGAGASARKLSANNSSQSLTCTEFCLPSKCCFAPMVQSDPTSQGLLLNKDGAYQSIETDEYIMTSCALKNYNSCQDYADACRDLIMPLSFWLDTVVFDLSTITFSPSISITPSTSTSRPTLQPTTERPTTQTPTKEAVESLPSGNDKPTREPTRETREPTLLPTVKVTKVALTTPPTTLPPVAPTVVVPIPDLAKIRDSCTGFQTYNLIARGEFNARTKCDNACNDGLCCYKDLGLGIEKSCFEGNEDVCALYSDCLVLRAKPNDVLATDSNSISPSTPVDDLANYCSSESICTPEGISNCFEACLPGSWCCGATGDSSCFNEFEESCSAYGQCLLMVDKYGGDSNQALPPIPPNNLQSACSYPALSAFHQSDGNVITECNQICDAGMCCMDGTCGEGTTATETAIADRCAAYEPCRHLLELPTPPDDMETLCKDKESSQCLDVCSIASCCWKSNDDGCFASFEQRCLSYAPYCSPNMSATGDFPAPPSPPPPDLCVSGPPSACRNACTSGPSCCFTPSIEVNCFSQNEETCGMWAKCAPFYQKDVELA